MSFDFLMAVILAWNLSGRDISTFLTTLGSGKVDYVFQLGIELIKRLIFLHLNLFKARSKPLKF